MKLGKLVNKEYLKRGASALTSIPVVFATATFNPTVSEAQVALNCTGNQRVVHADIKADAHVDDLRQETIYKDGGEQLFTLGGSADLTGIIINPAPGTNWENGYINYPDGTTTIGEFDIQNVNINGNNISWDQCLEGNQEFIFPAYIQNGKTIGTTANIGYTEACGTEECITQVFPVSKEDIWKGWNEGGVDSSAEQARQALQEQTREIVTGLDLYTATGEPFDANTINITRGDAGVFLLKTGSTFIKALSKGQIMSSDDQNVRVVDNIAYTIGPNATICPLAEEFIINGVNRLEAGCVNNLNQYEEQPYTQKRVLNADLTGPTTNDFRQETYGVIKDAEIITTGTFADKINTATAGNTTAFSVTYDKNSDNLRTEFWQNGGLVSIIDGNPADTILNNADTEIHGYLLDHKENPLHTYTTTVLGVPPFNITGVTSGGTTYTDANLDGWIDEIFSVECESTHTIDSINTDGPGPYNYSGGVLNGWNVNNGSPIYTPPCNDLGAHNITATLEKQGITATIGLQYNAVAKPAQPKITGLDALNNGTVELFDANGDNILDTTRNLACANPMSESDQPIIEPGPAGDYTWTVSNNPSWMSINGNTGLITSDPVCTNTKGLHSVSIQASGPPGTSDSFIINYNLQ